MPVPGVSDKLTRFCSDGLIIGQRSSYCRSWEEFIMYLIYCYFFFFSQLLITTMSCKGCAAEEHSGF